MSYFKRVALLKANQKIEPPNHTYASDLTEITYLGAYIENGVEYVTIPVSPYYRQPYKTFEKSLKRERFDFVGISSMTGGYISAQKYADIAKLAGAFVTMGGYHPTAMTSDGLADPNVDAVVCGEGEHPFRDLILHGPQEGVGGLSFKDKNGDQINLEDLDWLHRLVGVAEANALMVFTQKKAPFSKKYKQFFHCLPPISRTAGALALIFCKMLGRRFSVA